MLSDSIVKSFFQDLEQTVTQEPKSVYTFSFFFKSWDLKGNESSQNLNSNTWISYLSCTSDNYLS